MFEDNIGIILRTVSLIVGLSLIFSWLRYRYHRRKSDRCLKMVLDRVGDNITRSPEEVSMTFQQIEEEVVKNFVPIRDEDIEAEQHRAEDELEKFQTQGHYNTEEAKRVRAEVKAEDELAQDMKWRKERRDHSDGMLDKFDKIETAEEWNEAIKTHDAEREKMEIELAEKRSGYVVPPELINPDLFFNFDTQSPITPEKICPRCEAREYFEATMQIGDDDVVPVEKIEIKAATHNHCFRLRGEGEGVEPSCWCGELKSQTAAIRQRSFDDAFGTCTTTNESYYCGVCGGSGQRSFNGRVFDECPVCDGRGLIQ